jgi:Mn2+/Fe2+ NRAMP family transporter
MIGATLVGVVLNFIGIKPFDALFLSALINGMLAPPLLVLIMLLANRKSVMRARTNGPALNILGWATTIVMSLAAVGVVLTSGT